MKINLFFKALLPFALLAGATTLPLCAEYSVDVGLAGNAYVTKGDGAEVTSAGLQKWTNPDAVISAYFSVSETQPSVTLALRARGHATYEVSCGDKKFNVSIDSDDFALVPVGVVEFSKPGYQRVDIRGIGKAEDGDFGEVSEIVLEGISGPMNYVHNFEAYWGRRGPSVHMKYTPPVGKDIEYFYNEVYVPVGSDVLSTYFMACGFSGGYFGIQVNSETERRVLFSVWSPYETDNPNEIPEDYRVIFKKKGEDVQAEDFGNEGSGGKTFLRFPWRAGTPYKFLVRVRPSEDGTTEYAGYFFAPEENRWRHISTLIRPKTQTWLLRPHSFLENFSVSEGWKQRNVFFSNQWVRDKDGVWYEMTEGRFTCDNTGAKKVRVDFDGGLSEDEKSFELKNCGFFNGETEPGTMFARRELKDEPQIDFEQIETL